MDANIQTDFLNDDFIKPKYSNWGKLGILVGLILGGLIVTGIMQFIILFTMIDLKNLSNLSQENLIAVMAKPENFTKVVIMQGFGTLLLMALPAFFYAKIVHQKALAHLGFNSKFSIMQVLGVIGIAIIGLLLSSSLGEFTKIILPKALKTIADKWESNYEDGVAMFVNMKTTSDYLFSLFMIAILPAIFEEILFRGAIQKLLYDWVKNTQVSLIVTAIVFSAVHASIYGFLARFMLGYVLGYIYHYGKSLWLNILMHFINNGVAVTAMYFALKQGASLKGSMEDSMPIWVLPVSLSIMVAVLLFFKKESGKSTSSIQL